MSVNHNEKSGFYQKSLFSFHFPESGRNLTALVGKISIKGRNHMLKFPYFELLLIKSPVFCIIYALNLKKCPRYSRNCSPEAAVSMYLRVKYVILS